MLAKKSFSLISGFSVWLDNAAGVKIVCGPVWSNDSSGYFRQQHKITQNRWKDRDLYVKEMQLFYGLASRFFTINSDE